MKLNRRGFFGTLAAALAARYIPVAPIAFKPIAPVSMQEFASGFNGRPLTYRGKPVRCDEHMPSDRIYFINTNGIFWADNAGAMKL